MTKLTLDAALPYDLHLTQVPAAAQAAEALGLGALWTAETQHDPFLPLPLIAEHSQKIKFGTAIAVSFARSPMTLAYSAWDLARASAGRFLLGLGTQIKPHIERRFGMTWPRSPVGQLRSQIEALRAIWHSWQTGERLNFRDAHYKFTLMPPFFDPGPIDFPHIPIYIAGVNTGLAKLAGELCDGFHVHPLNSVRYLQEVLWPAIAEGVSRAEEGRKPPQLSVTAFVATNDVEVAAARQQISFYASTPSYRAVMALHGWAETAAELTRLSTRNQWEAMSGLISDEMVAAFTVIADPQHLAAALKQRYTGLVGRVTPYLPFVPGERDAFWQTLTQDWQDR